LLTEDEGEQVGAAGVVIGEATLELDVQAPDRSLPAWLDLFTGPRIN
jgi:hypothetical protein